jgi:hypothetical protein
MYCKTRKYITVLVVVLTMSAQTAFTVTPAPEATITVTS